MLAAFAGQARGFQSCSTNPAVLVAVVALELVADLVAGFAAVKSRTAEELCGIAALKTPVHC